MIHYAYLVKLIIRDGQYEYEHFDYFLSPFKNPSEKIAFESVWNLDYPKEDDGIRWLPGERALVDVGVREITDEQIVELKKLGIL